MSFKIRVYIVLISFLCIGKTAFTQGIVIPPDYLFYSGDTLSGFDFKTILDNPDIRTYNKYEILEYLHRKEREFIEGKYNIPTERRDHKAAQSQNIQPGVITSILASPCNNADFEDGDFTNWTGSIGCNGNSQGPLTITEGPTLDAAPGINTLGANSAVTSCSWQTIVTTGTDPYGGFSMLDPGGGAYAVRIGGSNVNRSKGSGGCGTNAMDPGGAFGEVLQQSFPVTLANSLFTINYAVVLNDGGHPASQEPYFSANVYDATNTLITCLSFSQECIAGSPPPNFQTSALTGPTSGAVYYLPWTARTFDLKPYIGTTITIVFTAAGCEPGGHFAYAYLDCLCGQVWPTVVPACTSATINAPPGGLAYSWSGPGIVSGGTTQSAVVNASGTYSVTVTTEAGPPACTYTLDTTIVVPSPINITITPTNILCNGGTGSASAVVTGGTPGYTYSWTNGQTNSNSTAMPAGSYTLTVKDINSCTQTGPITITQPNKLGGTLSTTPSNCAANNGSATINATGGTTAYSYLWNGGQTTSTISSIGPGTYSVTITDAHNCTLDTTVTVPSSGVTITPTIAPVNVLCNGGATGSATVTGVTGGATPYTYSWTNGQTGTNATGLIAGSYTVTVKDNNGCVGTGTATITQPTVITPTATATNALCNGGNGSITTAGTSGGTPGYTYSWTNGATTSSITAVAGSYTVTITDKNNCTTTANATITEPAAIAATSSTVAPTCGSSNGSASLTSVTGGTGAYSYLWSSGQTTSGITGIAVGNFTVTITDANSCTFPVAISVPNSNSPRDSITATVNEKCFGDAIGSAIVGVASGTPGYTYSWAPAGGTTATASSLTAGIYTVTVMDALGCTTTAIDTITQPTKLTLTASAFPASCNGECNGQLLSIPAGGTVNYTYLWSNGATSAGMLNACAATYSVVVTDANGCSVDSTGLVVTQPTALTGAITPVTATCGLANGSACINGGTAGGGTPGYTYMWSNGTTTTCMNNVVSANYSLIITDANKCNDTINTNVPNVPGDTALITGTVNEICFGDAVGTATGGGKGGTPPYTYSWAPSSQSTQTATSLIAGSYTVTVTDNIGCTSTAIATIIQPALVIASPSAPQAICIGQFATLSVSAVGGTPGYTYTWTPGGLTGPSVSVSPIVTTTYTVNTVDGNNCPGAPVTIVVTVNPPLSITISPNKATCPGGSVSFTANVKGGDSVYTYSWIPTAGLNTTTGPTVISTPGTTTEYTVTVKDGCGDVPVTDSVKAIVNPLPVVKFNADTLQGCTPLCVKFTDQSVIAAGGKLSSWSWAFGDSGTSMAKDTTYCYNKAGVFTVSLIVTSDSGCIDSLVVPKMITTYSHPIAAFTLSPQPVTILQPTIYFNDQSTDAYGIKSWLWQFGDFGDSSSALQNPSYTYSSVGTFCPVLKVTNVHGCVDTIQHCLIVSPFFTIYIPNAFTPNADGVNDVFTAKGTYICGFKMYIFDRWGMQLYYTDDIDKGWDGTVNGGNLVSQEDTYVYLITAIDCIEYKKHEFIGRVTIIK